MKALVVASNREDQLLRFLNDWDNADWDIIIVEDNPQRTFRLTSGCHHVSWAEIENDLGEDAWIISRRDSGIKCYGFLEAARIGADHIFVLDDDCLPDKFVEDFIEEHIQALEHTPRWFYTVPGYRTRGLPYFNQGQCPNVVLNVGLWNGEADVDAVTALSRGSHKNIPLPNHNRLVPHGQYFGLCGMNLCFKREILPLMYFPLMGIHQPYGRFDDIWCGLVVKKVCDHLNLSISVGSPNIYHEKASDPMNNLVREAPGIKMNEQYWEIIDQAQLSGTTLIECMDEVGSYLQESQDTYLQTWGKAIQIWTKLCPNP